MTAKGEGQAQGKQGKQAQGQGKQQAAPKSAISPTRAEDYPGWFQSVVREGDLAEMAHVRGCMVIKPWGYGIWENIQQHLGRMIKDTGHDNAYFPLFVPLAYIQKEAAHVEGFAKEMAVVTHHRLEMRDGKLVPAGELTEPVVVRPTSETIIGESMKSWIQSYRDLPLKLNQWCNVVRWEMRPRVFLRTTEFLWQEGHTAHATEAEARAEVDLMLEVYREFAEDWLALPVVRGAKPAYDRFPGAVETLAIEAMMQDGKALQAGTSHFLGQNFAKATGIQFADQDQQLSYVHTTSWGVSTRLIGGVIMTHSDDDGLRLPPRIAPQQVVIVPLQRGGDDDQATLAYARALAADLGKISFAGGKLQISARVDDSMYGAPEKKWKWIKRGVPIQLELGPRDVKNDAVTMSLRTEEPRAKRVLPRAELLATVAKLLDDMQAGYFAAAAQRLAAHTYTHIQDFAALKAHFENEGHIPGFVRAPWAPASADERLKDLAVTIRCLPLDQSGVSAKCVLTGNPTTTEAVFARSY